MARATNRQSLCALRLGFNDWRQKKKNKTKNKKKTKQNKKNQKPTKKPNHLYLLLGRSLKEFDEKDMFRSCDLV